MAQRRHRQGSFNGGLISGDMFGRPDQVSYANGLAVMRNMIATPQGPAQRRPGMKLVSNVGDSNFRTRVIPFTYSVDQTTVIELGNQFMRFHSNGAPIVWGQTNAIESVTDDGGDLLLTFFTNHSFSSNDAVKLTSNDDTPPGGITLGTVYYVIPVGDRTVKLSASSGPGAAVAFTTAGSGVMYLNLDSEMPDNHIASINFSDTTIAANLTGQGGGGDEIQFAVPHSFSNNQAIHLVAPPTGLSAGTVYYVNVVSPTSIQVDTAYPFASAIAHSAGSTPTCYSAELHIGASPQHTFNTPVRVSTTGTLPAQLQANTTYYVIGGTDTGILVSATLGGSPILPTSFTPVCTVHRYYATGEFIYWQGAGSDVFQARTNFYSAVAPPADSFNWKLQSPDGTYSILSPFTESQLFDVHYTQDADVMTLCHWSVAPQRLARYGAADWRIEAATFGSQVTAPTGVASAATFGSTIKVASVIVTQSNGYGYIQTDTGGEAHGLLVGDMVFCEGITNLTDGEYEVADDDAFGGNADEFALKSKGTGSKVTIAGSIASSGTVRIVPFSSGRTNEYAVTAVDSKNIESQPSSSVSTDNHLQVIGSFNTITWSAVTGAARYRIYKKEEGSQVFGYIGQTEADEAQSFKDNDISPDLSRTPPRILSVFTGTFPSAVGYFEQRLWFGGTFAEPQDLWGSRSGTDLDFSYHVPPLDDDAIQIRVKSGQVTHIRHVVALEDLLLLTNSSEFRVSPRNDDALTPTQISARQQTYVGASMVQPTLVDDVVLFTAERGGTLHEMGYSAARRRYVTSNLSNRARDLFDGKDIVDMALQKTPIPIVWCVSSDGNLLGFTYSPEEQVGAWHVHDIGGGLAESVAVVAEGDEDRLYVVVNFGGGFRRILRMDTLTQPSSAANLFYVDDGVTYSGSAANVIRGLGYLNGVEVSILADGVVQPKQTVANGQITLTTAASTVHIGRAYTSQLQFLPAALRVDGAARGLPMSLTHAFIRARNSYRFEFGDDLTRLTTSHPTGQLTDVTTGTFDDTLEADYESEAQLWVQQTDPVPLTVVEATIEFDVQGDLQ